MNEEALLKKIFSDGKLWRGKYEVDWCELCNSAIISCLEKNCFGCTCNCTGCDVCSEDKDYQEFRKAKTCVWQYLSDEERIIYEKTNFLKRYILESLQEGEFEINWKRMKEQGHLCGLSEQMFAKEIKESYDKQQNVPSFGTY